MTNEMHWARWGDPDKAAALPETARELVDAFLGTTPTPGMDESAVELPDALPDALVEGLGALVGNDHVHTDRELRLRRTRGKSTPDLLRMRRGDAASAPGAVVRPATHDEVAAIIEWCVAHTVALVPFGGGTSVVGGLAAEPGRFAGVIALDLERMKALVEVDRESMTATLEPGLRGPEAEQLLAEHGLTIGHYPQSFQYATIGGFAATRSSGQASSGFGRFDALVEGLRVATPIGELKLGNSPANAAGPDLRQLILGSEGAFGVVTAVTVRVRPVPARRHYEHWRADSFELGVRALRAIAQAGLHPTVLRLSDETETMVNLADPTSIGADGSGGALLVVGYEGDEATVLATRTAVGAVLDGLDVESLGEDESWADGRFDGPYLRDSLLDVGVLVETLETVTFWSNLARVYAAVKTALVDALGEPTLVLCHISHVYETGASLYFTVAAKQAADPVAQWQRAKVAACEAIVETGASITHHHAVGRDHLPWLAAEIGPVGVEILRAVKQRLDPAGVLNPGVLIP